MDVYREEGEMVKKFRRILLLLLLVGLAAGVLAGCRKEEVSDKGILVWGSDKANIVYAI